MSKPCLICFRLGSDVQSGPLASTQVITDCNSSADSYPSKKKLTQFFRLFERHINASSDAGGEYGGEETFSSKQLINAGMLSCGDCSKLIDSFCELYHQMKAIELQLDWKVWTLGNIMSSAQRVPTRVSDVKQLKIEYISGKDIITYKKCLIKKCREKLQIASFPRPLLTKCATKCTKTVVKTPPPQVPTSIPTNDWLMDLLNVSDHPVVPIPDEPFSYMQQPNGKIENENIRRATGEQFNPNNSIDDKNTFALMLVENKKETQSAIPIPNVEDIRSKQRIVHLCLKCMKTFPTAIRLEEHQKQGEYGCFNDKQAENPDADEPNPTSTNRTISNGMNPDGNFVSLGKVRSLNPKTGKHECDRCSKEFAQSWNLQRHLKRVHRLDVGYNCNFLYKSYKVHQNETEKVTSGPLPKLANDKRKHICRVCGKEFPWSAALIRHFQAVHLKLRRHSCQVCGKKFYASDGLTRHFRAVHLKLPNPSKLLKSKSNFQDKKDRLVSSKPSTTENAEGSINPSTSARCTNKPTNAHNGRRHGKSAHLKFRFSCTKCDKKFCRRSNFTVHLKNVHKVQYVSKRTNRKPKTLNPTRVGFHYSCSVCGKGFFSAYHLRRHFEAVHLQLKEHCCDKCGSSFGQRDALHRHQRAVHLGMKRQK